ncbi:MAG: hypothetical protein FD176_1885 [Rhodospirillaceae bacterium]|nr:MAG: hypothetical protein FD176_1885 [Rhodospirillaceae bacterium]TNC95396.1 MAG: hypothetical protein FD119_2520 [Stygiobacter sp.]
MGIPFDIDIKHATDWRTFAGKMGDVAAQGFLTALGGDGISGGISALFDALAAIGKTEKSPGRQGWELFCLSFAWAFDSLRQDFCKPDVAKQAAKAALEQARTRLTEAQYEITTDFLNYPSSLPLYREIRDAFVDRRAEFRPQGTESAESLKARFDSAFNRAIHAVWSQQPDRFAALAQALHAPGLEASASERQWQAYRQQLIHEFTVKPVFGQEQTRVSLSQLYVPLRGTWREKAKGRDERYQEHIPERAPRHLLRLDDMLDNWVDATSSKEDWLRLIGGGPGSGKSTTLKALAARLAGRDDIRPIYVPLQHMNLNQSLREAVNSWLTQTVESAFRQPPLERQAVENGPRLVLIFDGLDELSRPGGEGAAQVVNLFANRLQALRNELGTHILALVASRTVGFQEAIKYLATQPEQAVEVAGLCLLGNTSNMIGDEAIKRQDQRPDWWYSYAIATGQRSATPVAMTHKSLKTLTTEPLLCYLLALSGYVTDNWREAAENHNRIYERLIGDVWRRGWGDGGRLGPGRALTQEDFVRLMESVALAAWHGGDTRTADETRFAEACDILGTTDIWADFKNINGPDMGNLALTFYLKTCDHDRRGFEFTHKSFGDYLTARALFAIARDLAPQIKRNKKSAAGEWLKAIGNGKLTAEIIDFIRAEASLAGPQTCKDVQASFEMLAPHALAEGLPAHNDAKYWREAEIRQDSAEWAVWAMMNAAARITGTLSNIKFPDRNSLDALLSRVRHDGHLFNTCLSHTEINHTDIILRSLHIMDITRSNIKDVKFTQVQTTQSTMTNTIFTGCAFYGVSFIRSFISDAKFYNCTFKDSLFEYCDISNTYIENTTTDEKLCGEIGAQGTLRKDGLILIPPGYLNTDEDGNIRFTPK